MELTLRFPETLQYCKVSITLFCNTTHFDSFSLSARCQQVIIRASDSFKPGHIPDNRIDAAGPWRVCAARTERGCCPWWRLSAPRPPSLAPSRQGCTHTYATNALGRQPILLASSEELSPCETRGEHCVAMSAEQQMSFKAWGIDQGNVPAALHARVPALKPGMDGEWHWNRMTDDPSYAGPTCRPINHFVWKWSGTQVTVTNLINAMGGDSEESIVLDEQCSPPSAAAPPPPPA